MKSRKNLLWAMIGIVAVVCLVVVFLATGNKDDNSDIAQNPENNNPIGDSSQELIVGVQIPMVLGTYMFESYVDSSYIMGIENGLGDNGTALILTPVDESNANRIMIANEADSEGYYNLQASHTNSYIQSTSGKNGEVVSQNKTIADNGTEKWSFIYCGRENDKDVVIIKNADGTVLKPADGKISAGSKIVLAKEDMNDDTQKWYVKWSERNEESNIIVYNEGDLVESKSGIKTLASALDGKTMISVSQDPSLANPELIVWENVWDETQQFEFVLQNKESRYKIYPINNNADKKKCLEFDEATQKIIVKEENNSNNQLFRVVYAGNDMYLIQAYNESVLGFDLNADGTSNGPAVVARPYEEFEDSRLEKWIIADVNQ